MTDNNSAGLIPTVLIGGSGGTVVGNENSGLSGGDSGSGIIVSSNNIEPLENDQRFQYLWKIISRSMRIKTDKWNKLLATDDYKNIIRDWLEKHNKQMLIISMLPNNTLIPALSFPIKTRLKSCYFIKKYKITLIPINMDDQVIYGDLSIKPLEDLSIFFKAIVHPLLSRMENRTEWSEQLAKDIDQKCQNLVNTITEVKSSINNETILQLPSNLNEIVLIALEFQLGKQFDLETKLKNELEGSVIKWSYQLNEVICKGPESVFSKTQFQQIQPTPQTEHDYWNTRYTNLYNIYKQLTNRYIKSIGQILEAIDSVYYLSFKTIMQNTVKELNRARDIVIYLNAIMPSFEQLIKIDFDKIQPLIPPLLACLSRMWANSLFYTSNDWQRFFQMIFNLIIIQASTYLDSSSIFQNDIDEGLNRLIDVLETLKYLKQQIFIAKQKLHNYKPADGSYPSITWQLNQNNNRLVFGRFDRFVERLQAIKAIFVTAFEFEKLDRIELGGVRGRYLSQRILNISQDYQKLYNLWTVIDFDPLEPNDNCSKFDSLLKEYKKKSNELERSLAQIFIEAFDSCYDVQQGIKLIEMAGTLFCTPTINAQVQPKFQLIINLYQDEVETVYKSFQMGKQKYDTYGIKELQCECDFTVTAGALLWLIKLRKRLTIPLQDLPYLEFPIFDSEDGNLILKRKDTILLELSLLEAEILKKWYNDLQQIISENMGKNLLMRTNGYLILNFDDLLTYNLREIKTIKYMEIKSELLKEVETVFSLTDLLWQTRLMLSRVVEWYNFMKDQIQKCEFDIIAKHMTRIDQDLNEAINISTWCHYRQGYVKYIYDNIQNLYIRISKIHQNIKEIIANINVWAMRPMYQRKRNGMSTELLDIEHISDEFQNRSANIAETQILISMKMEENYRLFFYLDMNLTDQEKPSNIGDDEKVQKKRRFEAFLGLGKSVDNEIDIKTGTRRTIHSARSLLNVKNSNPISKNPEDLLLFAPYEEYVDKLVSNALIHSVQLSIDYICEQMFTGSPIFEITLKIQDNQFKFVPYLVTPTNCHSKDSKNSIEATLNEMFQNILSTLDLMPKIASGKYCETCSTSGISSNEIHSNGKIEEKRKQIFNKFQMTINEVNLFINQYQEYEHIWQEDKDKYIKKLNNSEIKKGPNLEEFTKEINCWSATYEELDKNIANDCILDNWLHLNLREFKQTLLNECCKWRHHYQQYLVKHLITSLSDLEKFITIGWTILSCTLNTNTCGTDNIIQGSNEFEKLLSILSIINQIDTRAKFIKKQFFDPLNDILEMLNQYNVEVNDLVIAQFTELPDKWEELKKLSAQVVETIAPIQNQQVSLINRKIIAFDGRLNSFREEFKNLEMSKCNDPYEKCNKSHNELKILEAQFIQLQKSAELFRLNSPNECKLVICRKELQLAKKLWDFVFVIRSCVNDWKKTAWKLLDVEEMEQQCKKLSKDIRGLGKECQFWPPYIEIDQMLRNLLTSLKAITELQNPAIQDRHWIELMQSTNINIRTNENTTLRELLELNLHEFEEDVKTTVDRAVKELAMKKVLTDIATVWKHMKFEFELDEKSGLSLLKASEELIETLEDHQVQVHNMTNSKYIKYFEKKFNEWMDRLELAELVIQTWSDVQRKWMYLESIFIRSDDLRMQLPNDAKVFDDIDNEFRFVINDIRNAKTDIITTTNTNGLCEKIQQLQSGLFQCEKALNEYLETKRLAYPRFYFISSTDLLDILSNGNNPLAVERHLSKLFDSIMKLRFTDTLDKAIGMFSKENEEYVEFSESCDCSGKVEVWLNSVTDRMRQTLRNTFSIAVCDYDRKLREQWVFDFPAQTALCITQIWWSIEVIQAFQRQQEGYEMALKDYQRKQIFQLNSLITLLLGDLSTGDRQKIMTICTVDVHSRDIVAKIISQKVNSAKAFPWQSQLRHRWDTETNNCYANICDAEFRYDYEYLGNTPRLVITPLTDRCYITLTQSLHLIMGGAPAGPAGTGKTETTKDLGKGLGIMVYVFNCSEQMDYRSCGNIYKGLAQTGAWGCFDEFNRISIEVLSVVAVQVKCILDAIKRQKTNFIFMGQTIALTPTVGIFVTMNPGYAGRTELPENLKALFRPCAMVVPDFALICEIMLVAEGFQEARILARKFITLYTLCKELLSQQDHYDWGLRAIKSVLVVAGTLRRSDRQRPEDQVLMRALRDFNIPKIITDDMTIFMGLIGDLFPALVVPRKRSIEFEKCVRKSAKELKLQPDDCFILKVVQLCELLAVRHSVFIVGNAGTGKTNIWKTLYRTYLKQKLKPIYNDLNPKAVSNDELFGVINPSTRDWKDGLFSIIMRDQANILSDNPKWIVLDGDIDPMWIESLNTVMDDNKVLTLASNERIALTKEMRLLFEVCDLKYATPATVSRAGILYVNANDLGWYPYVASWIETKGNQIDSNQIMYLFDKYIPTLVEAIKKFKTITPVIEISMIQMICYLLDYLLDYSTDNDRIIIKPSVTEYIDEDNNTVSDKPPSPTISDNDWLELRFVFATIWGFGSALHQDQIIDWRLEFNKYWLAEFNSIKFPDDGNIFSFYIDFQSKSLCPWSNLISKFELDSDTPLQSMLVPTEETIRIRWFLEKLISRQHPVMLVGGAGSGKSIIIENILNTLPDCLINIPLNFYTSSEMLQKHLEQPLEKKAGRNFAPIGKRHMIYFVDDINMPAMDDFGTVQSHQIIRQFMDYHHWYDRTKYNLKEIQNCQFCACMNPTAGSFTIDPRLQRHFCAFAINYPSENSMFIIYNSIFQQHLSTVWHRFTVQHQRIGTALVQMGLNLHSRMGQMFLPTAVKFHYIFNLRDLTNIFQGLLFATRDTCPEPIDLCRLYVHEAFRVYGDKLVSEIDQDNFRKLIREVFKKSIEETDDQFVFREPLIYCHFADGLADPKYMPIHKWKDLLALLNEAQNGYNEMVGFSNLVLFEDAMAHICRINRIIECSRGNALLVGVGGSGKQSLARLAAYISSLSVTQIQLKRDYAMVDLKADLNILYTKVGVKNIPSMFLMTDAQVADEVFLVAINDMLASGEVFELFTDDEKETISNAVRNEVKQMGSADTKDNCWKHFIDKVRKTLKIVLCFSPVGSTLRCRARKFPALINCTSINWFHEWPKAALESVSKKFLKDLDILPKELVDSVAVFMAYVLDSVNEISKAYLINEKRYNYTTPKSFLELISLYSKLLRDKTSDTIKKITRLENGLVKLGQCAEQVDSLKHVLAEQETALQAKNEASDKLIIVVGEENEIVQKEKKIAAYEEQKVRTIEEDVSIKTKLCEEDLRKAEPALLAAQEALNTLNKNNLTELKSFGTPPQAVVNVCAAVLVLCSASKHKLPKDRSWRVCKQMMGAVDKFLNQLLRFDKEHIPARVISALQPYLKDPEFDPQKILAKSAAASGLCAWVINIHQFYNVYQIVGPKQIALKEAQSELKAAQTKLNYFNDKIQAIEVQLSKIQREFDQALTDKIKYQTEADKTSLTIDLAHRLVNGLGSEAIRWHQSVEKLRNRISKLPGDALFIASFVSYVGCFTIRYRIDLMEKMWKPAFAELKPEIPCTKEIDILDLICDDADIAAWNNEGLPSDRMSTENAIILLNSSRWPLLIDPQLQAVKWIKQKYGSQLVVVNLKDQGYLDVIENAVTCGATILLENIDETVDAVIDPLLSRTLIKKGQAIKFGDKEVDFNPNFKLILQTKLANPHFKPEMQAQTTLINFTVTKDGLADQLLAEVVKAERPDLELLKSDLTIQQNMFKISLKTLEDDLLERLSSSDESILEDPTLVENLEQTKSTAAEIETKACEAKLTAAKIDEARELYRAAAERSSILYFILNELFKINEMYQFSLKAFIVVFKRAIKIATQYTDLTARVNSLVNSITYNVFLYTCRGLFEKDKLVFMTQMVIQILCNTGEISPKELDFLFRFPPHCPPIQSPFDFLTNIQWGGLRVLSLIDGFRGIDKEFEQSSKRWRQFVESETPEQDKLPGEWKTKTPFQRLCIIRTVRPDRVTYAARCFVEEILGKKYTESRQVPFAESFKECSATIPVFFILSPGVDPLADVERLGKQMNFTIDHENFYNISLGQGQEIVAEHAIERASRHGHWVILQNIHLVAKWLPKLEKRIEEILENGAHSNYRLFISAEPAPSSDYHIIPQGILESAVKVTNEPPTGMQANLHKALDNFNQETLEMCTKEAEFKSVLFALCYFHAVVAERRKFGPQGWNIMYPFNVGDLTISVYVLYNYLEGNKHVPWEDLRYLFGEIMYGGHITDEWDRRLCRTYLEELMQPNLVDGDIDLCKDFEAPPNLDYLGYHQYITEILPSESPALYGMHSNSEIGLLNNLSDNLLKTVFELQPRRPSTSSDGVQSREESVKQIIEEFQDKLPPEFNITELATRIESRTPFISVAFQECERMNILLTEMRRSMRELSLGLKGELSITREMETLDACLMYDTVPIYWTKLAYPSILSLQAWYLNLLQRHKELDRWIQDFCLPTTVWLAAFFNPQSFLTAIMQTTARKNKWPLDRMCLNVDVTNKSKDDFSFPPKEGAYIHGLFMEGARWDTVSNSIGPAKLKELFPLMPIILIRATTQDKQEIKNIFECPVYRTRSRGTTFIWTFNLKSKEKPSKWILGGVAILLQS